MSAAYLDDGATQPVQLDGRATPPVVVTARDVQDPERLARMVQDQANRIALLERRYNPPVLYFRDRPVTSTTTAKLRFEHGFGQRVNWEVAGWDATAAGTAHALDQHADTDADTLVLVSGVAGTVTIRVEGAG